MATCYSFPDIVSLGEPQVACLGKIGDSFASYQEPGACEAFTKQVKMVEAFLIQLYVTAASFSRKTDDLAEAAEIWSRMSDFCSSSLGVLSRLREKYPYCGTPEVYDLALDYKLASQNRYNGVLEEIECQKTTPPTGLFPETI